MVQHDHHHNDDEEEFQTDPAQQQQQQQDHYYYRFLLLTHKDTNILTLATAQQSGLLSLPENFPLKIESADLSLIKNESDMKELLLGDEEDDATKMIIVAQLLGRGVPGFQYLMDFSSQARKCHHLIVISGIPGSFEPDLTAMCVNVTQDVICQVVAYFEADGCAKNMAQMIRYLADSLLDSPNKLGYEPPTLQPNHGLYHPRFVTAGYNNDNDTTSSSTTPTNRTSLEETMASYLQQQNSPETKKPAIIAILFYRCHYLSGNTAFVDAIIDELECMGHKAIGLFTESLREFVSDDNNTEDIVNVNGQNLPACRFPKVLTHLINPTTGECIVDVLICTMAFAMGEISNTNDGGGPTMVGSWSTAALEALNIPILQAITSVETKDHWQDAARGLNPLDTAMNVAIPEFDGRIITVPISFKTPQDETNKVHYYEPVLDRVEAVAKQASRWARLKHTPNTNKRIAFMLTNSSGKAERIGDAVGLDTPASLIHLFTAMKQAGYNFGDNAKADFPKDGDQLIQDLVDRCSYDTIYLTEEQLANAAGRVSTEVYQRLFDDLPAKQKQHMIEQWGQPPGEAYVDDEGSIALAGLEFGNIFVALQPPRGYGMDPDKIYHTPDLPPPHNYFACYRWLRDVWKADAIVHMGKHGTLEWLPGKGVGLSQDCYPDTFLDDFPLVYPFIINDPGEGTQSKRRAHAVIIDHMCPPMTTADGYGELAQLMQLVDEYYQIEMLDPTKMPLIQKQIWSLIQKINLGDDLAMILHHDHEHDHDHHNHNNSNDNGQQQQPQQQPKNNNGDHHHVVHNHKGEGEDSPHDNHHHHGHQHSHNNNHKDHHDHQHSHKNDDNGGEHAHEHGHEHEHGHQHHLESRDNQHQHLHEHHHESSQETKPTDSNNEKEHHHHEHEHRQHHESHEHQHEHNHKTQETLPADTPEKKHHHHEHEHQHNHDHHDHDGTSKPMDETALANMDGKDVAHLIEDLDGYLCELAGAQIRDGLHVLGQVPQGDSMVDTLQALTRLSNMDIPSLRELVASVFNLDLEQLLSNQGARLGNVPAPLISLAGRPLVSAGDAVETIDELSKHMIALLAENHFKQNTIPSIIKQTFDGKVGASVSSEITTTLRFVCETLIPSLNGTTQEISNLLKALDGEFVPAGPSGSPTRGMAHLLPTGRNFYAVDPYALPSMAAWEVGQNLAKEVLSRYLTETKAYPEHVAISVWGTAAMRTHGDDIAEIFALLGVRPCWEKENRRVTGVELIPLSELGHPRIDVTVRISGFFRDAFPNLITLLDDAVNLAINADEPPEQNFIRKHFLEDLKDKTKDEDSARYRIFGCPPGAYGIGILDLIESQNWKDESDFAKCYINWGGYAYSSKDPHGVDARSEFSHRLTTVEVAIHNQDDREHDIFDSDDYFQFHGGMIATIKALSGKKPRGYFGDTQNPATPKVRDIKEEALRVYRTRVVNPKWLESISRHGYKGASEMAATVDYLFGFDATANVVSDHMYEQVARSYALDERVQKFYEESNPWALRGISERLLEAAQRGMWAEPSQETLERLRQTLQTADSMLEGRSEGAQVD